MSELPDLVRAALERRRAGDACARSTGSRPASPWTARVVPGDLRVVRPLAHLPAEGRLALVVAVDSDREAARVHLAHTAPELATPADEVVARLASSARYDVVVQADVQGWVWTLQLGHAVGRVAAQVVEAVAEIGASTSPSAAGDERRSFKEAEAVAMDRLSQDCTEAHRDAPEVWSLEPCLLDPDVLAAEDDPELVLYELLHWARTRDVGIDGAALVELMAGGALEVDRWRALGDLGLDVWTSLQDLLLDAATGADRLPPGAPLVTSSGLQGDAADDVHVLGAPRPDARVGA